MRLTSAFSQGGPPRSRAPAVGTSFISEFHNGFAIGAVSIQGNCRPQDRLPVLENDWRDVHFSYEVGYMRDFLVVQTKLPHKADLNICTKPTLTASAKHNT